MREASTHAVVALAALALGAGLILAATVVYPGGHLTDPAAPGHDLWRNFLSDLLASKAPDDAPNVAGAALARLGVLLVGLALGLFWWRLVPALMGARGEARLVRVVRIAGAASSLALVPLVLTADVGGPVHPIATYSAALPGMLAACAALAGLWRVRPALAGLGALLLAAAAIDALLYGLFIMAEGSQPSWAEALPAVQRLGFFLLLAWVAAGGLQVLREPAA